MQICSPTSELWSQNLDLKNSPLKLPVRWGGGVENQDNSFHSVLFYEIQQVTHNLMIIT